jgi:hypothetical protein
VKPDLVNDRRRLKHEYNEFKARINNIPYSLRDRSDKFNAREEIGEMNLLSL